ncbi:hypothetical protein OV090_01685 [Nannocystis sp. RBIL2]|uniref:hypothetical protein n=1 Tax=Nannocystis sp. RBIL2 TaxID=2996788 RepID=UPI00226FCFAC|nr:hypothetical protein [Nannocystis sp. RBIL2]MCY1063452.1 hypothetical protein [Nannocystis sp. RBIL2]
MQWPLPAAVLAVAWLAPGLALAFQPSTGDSGPPPGSSQPPPTATQTPTLEPPAPSAAPPPASPDATGLEGPVPPTRTEAVDIDALQKELRALRTRVDRAEKRLAVQEQRRTIDDQRAMPSTGYNQWTAGNAMATRLTFAISDDNLLAGAKDRSPSAGFKLAADRLFYDAIEQEKRGFETETQLVVYKRMPTFFKRMDAEAAFVTEIEQWHDGKTFQNYTTLSDDGSYGKLNFYTKRNDYTGDNISLTMFPVDSQRFLLGYTYAVTWGGERMFPNNTGQTPGLRLRYDWNVGTGKDSYVFLGAKSARLLNEKLNEPQTYYSALGGFGIGFTPWLAWEVNGGYYQSGAFPMFSPNSRIGGKTVQTFGGSTRLTAHWGVPIGTSIDFQLFRYSPDASFLLTQNQIYDNRIAGSAAVEFTTVGQTLQKFEEPDTTRIQPAKAAAFLGKLRIKKLRLFANAIYRDLAFVVLSIPGVFPYQTFPREAQVAPELWGSLGFDYYFERSKLTPGAVLAYKSPASIKVGDTTNVYREFWDQEVLPAGQNPFDILSGKLTLKWDIAPFFVVVSELRYTLDNNRTKFVKASNESGRIRVFEDANVTNRLGFFLLAQARW